MRFRFAGRKLVCLIFSSFVHSPLCFPYAFLFSAHFGSLRKHKLHVTYSHWHCLCSCWPHPGANANSKQIEKKLCIFFSNLVCHLRVHLWKRLLEPVGPLIINELAPPAKWPKNAPLLQLSSSSSNCSANFGSFFRLVWSSAGTVAWLAWINNWAAAALAQSPGCQPLYLSLSPHWPRIIT